MRPGRATTLRSQVTTGLCALAISLGCLASTANAAGAASLEYPVKANYLVKFTAFVQWPPDAFTSAATPITVCVVGDDPFGAALDQAARGKSVEGRGVVVRRLSRIDARSGCQVAYLGRSRAQSQAQALSALAGAPVLTVTDSARGDGPRGAIHFAISGNRVRFHIDQGVADRARLSISSRLLTLALSVRSRGGS
jgi:hypothetical protein